MASSTTPDTSAPRSLPTDAELSEALRVEVFDREGKTHALGELVKGKRSVLIFIRHFFLAIGCGSYQPIDAYAAKSSSAYPIYTDPSLRLHKLFQFKYNLSEGQSGNEQKDYMRNAGSAMSRVLGGIKGALGSLQYLNHVGPKALNGGEVVISAGGECEYMYRMQNTVDHTNISELARLIGVECKASDHDEQTKQPCGDACTTEAK